MTKKKNQPPTSTSPYSPSHSLSAQSVYQDNCLHISLKHDTPSVVEKKRQVQDDAKGQRKATPTTRPEYSPSFFKHALRKVPLDMDYSVNRYLYYDDADAAPTNILSKQITRAGDTRGRDGYRGNAKVRQKEVARLLTQIGAWAIVDERQLNGC